MKNLIKSVVIFFLSFMLFSCTQNIKIASTDKFSVSISSDKLRTLLVKNRDNATNYEDTEHCEIFGQIINNQTKKVIQTSKIQSFTYEELDVETPEEIIIKFEPIFAGLDVYVTVEIDSVSNSTRYISDLLRTDSFIVQKGENIVNKQSMYRFLPFENYTTWMSSVDSFSNCIFYYPQENQSVYIKAKNGYSLEALLGCDDTNVSFLPVGNNQVKLINADTKTEIENNGYTFYVYAIGNYGFILKTIDSNNNENYALVSSSLFSPVFADVEYEYKIPTRQELEDFEFILDKGINNAPVDNYFYYEVPYIYFSKCVDYSTVAEPTIEGVSESEVSLGESIYYDTNSFTYCIQIEELTAEYLVLINDLNTSYFFELSKFPTNAGESCEKFDIYTSDSLSDTAEKVTIKNSTFYITFSNIFQTSATGDTEYYWGDFTIKNIGSYVN